MSWKEANSSCRKRNGTLSSIHSNWENAYIERILDSTFLEAGGMNFWIGLSRANENSAFIWSDHSQLDFKWWYRNVNVGNCVSISGAAPKFKWFADKCAFNQRYICTVSGMSPSLLFLSKSISGNIEFSKIIAHTTKISLSPLSNFQLITDSF